MRISAKILTKGGKSDRITVYSCFTDKRNSERKKNMLGGYKVIGLIVPMLREYIQSDLYRAVANRVVEYGYKMFIYNSTSDFKFDDNYSQGEKSVFDYIDYDVLDGLVILGEAVKDEELLEGIVRKAREHGIFTVSVDKRIEGCCNIEYNYYSAFEAIVRHVIEKHGCRVINIMAGMKGNKFSDERLECARRVMKEHGIELEENRIQYGEFWTGPTIAEMERFAKSGLSMPEAFICCNDSMAMAVCGWLKGRGYAVPDQIIVTGFDGMYEEQFHIPRLTTAKQDTELAGMKAVDAIAAHLEGRKTDNFYIIDHKVVYSHSCGCHPINYREASGIIFPLFDMMSEDNKTDTFILELDDTITACETLVDLSANVLAYSSVYGWYYYTLCINRNFMSLSDDYQNYINDSSSADTDSLSLILCESFDGVSCPPYCSEGPRMFRTALDKYNIFIYWAIHFQSLPVGYGISALSTGTDGFTKNEDFRRFAKYSRNLNHSLEVANSQSVLKKVINKLQELYIKDHTGLLNRNGFYDLIHKKLDEALQSGEKKYLVIISMDMDGLKTINDKYGHAEGDVAINAIASALKSVWGENELCARFGGDEFTIASICSEDPNDRGLDITRRIKEHLESFNKASGKPYRVRGSYGIWYEVIKAHMVTDDLIKHADDLMYKEKATHMESRYSRQ